MNLGEMDMSEQNAALMARPPADRISPLGRTKTERYGWTIVDRPGEFAMIPKGEFVVDPSYQRHLKERRVLAIVSQWSWIACGCIEAVLRPSDAAYFVIDGQHRVEAAKRRADITHLPALIFEVDGIAAEAKGFLDANTLRKPPDMSERFNALIKSQDPTALTIQELLRDSGRRVSQASQPDTISCVAAVIKCLNANERAFRAIWPVIIDLNRGFTIHQRLIYGMFYLETHLQGASLAQRQWHSRILLVGRTKLMDSIAKASAFLGQATPKAGAEGIANAINAGLRNRLPYGLPASDVTIGKGANGKAIA